MTDDIPQHITPQSVDTMSSDELDKLLAGIRDRRLKAVRIHEQAVREAQEAADERTRVALAKQCEMCANAITRADKAISALETRVMKIRALRLELGIE